MLHHPGEHAKYLEVTAALQLERWPVEAGSREQPAAHIAGRGKSIVLAAAAAVVVVQLLALASLLVVAAGRS